MDEAVSRGVIPCGTCGASGATMREVDGKKHFLCGRCAGRRRFWIAGLVGIVILAAVVAVSLIPGTGGASKAEFEERVSSIRAALAGGAPERALAEARQALADYPDSGVLHFLSGQALLAMSRSHLAVPHFEKSLREGGESSEDCLLALGRAYAQSDRPADSLKHLETPFTDPRLDGLRMLMLSGVYLELERYEDALKLIPELKPSPGALRSRFRALSYSGKDGEALNLLESLPPDDLGAIMLRAAHQREHGDFAEALATLGTPKPEKGSIADLRLRRSRLSVLMEKGDTDALLDETGALMEVKRRPYADNARWYRCMALLVAGRRDEARALAKEYLERVSPDYSPLRQERLTMEHLAGGIPAEKIVTEAKATSRVRANDLYYYLAVSTGEKAWAEKARDATPRRNFPYHAIRRLLDQ